MDGPTPRMLGNLIRAVAILALPAEDQLAWVESDGGGPLVDELALQLDDGAKLAPQFVEAGWLGGEVVPPLHALNLLLEDMSGEKNASLWNLGALADSARWAEVRARAKVVLNAIH